MYRVGFPLWKLAARVGLPLEVRVFVHYDPEVRNYWTTSPDVKGMVVTGNSFDEVLKEAQAGIDELMDLELNGHQPRSPPRLNLIPDAPCAA